MARRSKGFNSPFSSLTLKAENPTKPPAPPAAQASASPTSPAASAGDDSELFLRAMSGAQPLPARGRTDRVPPPKEAKTLPATDDELALAELQNLVAGGGTFRVSESEEMHTGIAPGVSYQLLERLQKGHFAFHRHLDLHGLSREAAHDEVRRFVTAARRDGERCVLIITGRGKSSPGGVSVLRDALPRWLTRAPLRVHVLAFCTARAVDGGPGAFYVLLRRSGVKPYGTGMETDG